MSLQVVRTYSYGFVRTPYLAHNSIHCCGYGAIEECRNRMPSHVISGILGKKGMFNYTPAQFHLSCPYVVLIIIISGRAEGDKTGLRRTYENAFCDVVKRGGHGVNDGL